MTALVPFLKVLYRDFPQKNNSVDFGEWLQEKQKANLDFISDTFSEGREEVSLEQISSQDLSHLDSQVKLVFMRNRRKILMDSQGFWGAIGFRFLPKNLALRFFIFILLIIICLAAVYGLLIKSNTRLSISLTNTHYSHTIMFPFGLNDRNNFETKAPNETTVKNGIPFAKPDTAVLPSIAKSDTIKKNVLVKKRPKVLVSIDSTGQNAALPPQIQHTKRPRLPDTLSENPYFSKNNSKDPLTPQPTKQKSPSLERSGYNPAGTAKKPTSMDSIGLGQ